MKETIYTCDHCEETTTTNSLFTITTTIKRGTTNYSVHTDICQKCLQEHGILPEKQDTPPKDETENKIKENQLPLIEKFKKSFIASFYASPFINFIEMRYKAYKKYRNS